MSGKSRELRQQEQLARAERLQAAIADLEAGLRQIEDSGVVAPAGCYVARYQARGQQKTYWYYKLQASDPIFPRARESGQPSRYRHLGPAGSEAHVEGVKQVLRRVQIDEFHKAIAALKESWSDLYDSSEPNPVQKTDK